MPDTHRRKNQQNFLSTYYVPGPESHSRVLSRYSRVRLFVTLWTLALQAPLSLGFSRQEHWSGLPCPPPGHLSDPRIKPASLMSPALAGGFFNTSATWEAPPSSFFNSSLLLKSLLQLSFTYTVIFSLKLFSQ